MGANWDPFMRTWDLLPMGTLNYKESAVCSTAHLHCSTLAWALGLGSLWISMPLAFMACRWKSITVAQDEGQKKLNKIKHNETSCQWCPLRVLMVGGDCVTSVTHTWFPKILWIYLTHPSGKRPTGSVWKQWRPTWRGIRHNCLSLLDKQIRFLFFYFFFAICLRLPPRGCRASAAHCSGQILATHSDKSKVERQFPGKKSVTWPRIVIDL